jgi:AcrR family transcriptional regulator
MAAWDRAAVGGPTGEMPVTTPQRQTDEVRDGAHERSLSGEKATRIVEAMRESVAEVGIVGSTFERVAGKAGVSRGLLHYYFGTKERLLVEVIRRDTDYRIEALSEAMRAAETVDEVIGAMFDTFERTLREQTGYVYMVSELYVAGRNSPDLQRELGALYGKARAEFAKILRAKEQEGVVSLRYPPEAVLAYLIAAGDGLTVQRLTDPSLDLVKTTEAAVGVARFLLAAE